MRRIIMESAQAYPIQKHEMRRWEEDEISDEEMKRRERKYWEAMGRLCKEKERQCV